MPLPTQRSPLSLDFKDGAHQSVEYAYDANGNQTKDLNRGISQLAYNCLNLPQKVSFVRPGNPTMEYVYTAVGAKLRVTHRSSTEKRTDYVGNFIYENGNLKRVLVDGGYYEPGLNRYCFYLQDHQGNNRVVADQGGSVVQSNHYYPYGLPFAEGVEPAAQPYKYNGKELDTEYGLNLYDYEARYTDPALGRFTTVDPLAEKYYAMSPYGYCGGNPMNRVDPDGRDWYKVRDENKGWEYRYNDKTHSQNALDKIMENGMYLGKTFTDVENNVYYSLFGSQIAANSFGGAIYQKLDAAIIKVGTAKQDNLSNWGGEDISSPVTDFSIEGKTAKNTKYLGIDSHRNEYSINYENSSVGVYRVTEGKNSMKAYMENWVGDRNMPMHIGEWKGGKKMYHIRFMNKTGYDIIHLQYSQQSASVILRKYNNLFFNEK